MTRTIKTVHIKDAEGNIVARRVASKFYLTDALKAQAEGFCVEMVTEVRYMDDETFLLTSVLKEESR